MLRLLKISVAVVLIGAALGATASRLNRVDAGIVLGSTTAPTPITFVQWHQYVNSIAASSFTTTALTGTTINNTFVVGMQWGGTSTISNLTASNGSSCPSITATQNVALGPSTIIAYCTNVASGSTTFTATFSGTPSYFVAEMFEFAGVTTTAPDAGLGAVNTATGANALSLTTNGNIPQANDLVVSAFACGSCTGATVASPGINPGVSDAAYQLVDASGGTVTHNWTTTGSAGGVVGSIGVLKH